MAKTVRELIAGSTWEVANGFGELSPKVTIPLPTFRRGDNGLLRQCIESVLAQTFTDFELIIIDDASVDSTRAIIEEFIAIDPRVATIRHRRNVGLPTVSCNEAILRARADMIFFAFDDDIFEPDALQTLWDYHLEHPEAVFMHGIAKAPAPGEEPAYFGRGGFEMSRLRVANTIPNCAVLMHRLVFDSVGLYDPHVSMIRIADWDLWLRIAERFEIHSVDKVLVTELGRTQLDSLGNSQLFDAALTREWFSQSRDASLLPDRFLDYDVAAAPASLSPLARAKIGSLVATRYPWMQSSEEPPPTGYVLLVCDQFDEPFETVFAGLPTGIAAHFVTAGHAQLHFFRMYDLVLGASCVVFYGGGEITVALAQLLRTHQSPYYLFVGDERSAAAVVECDAADPGFIAGCQGVIVVAGEVRERSVRDGLHPNIIGLAGTSGGPSELIGTLLRAHPARTITEVMGMLNTSIEIRHAIPAGYYTPREFLAELGGRLRARPFSTLRSVLRAAFRRRGERTVRPGTGAEIAAEPTDGD